MASLSGNCLTIASASGSAIIMTVILGSFEVAVRGLVVLRRERIDRLAMPVTCMTSRLATAPFGRLGFAPVRKASKSAR